VGFALVLAPPIVPWIDAFTRSIAAVSGLVIRMGGGRVNVLNQTLTAPATGFSLAVMYGCNGINVMIMLWSAQLAWPSNNWIKKLKGMLLGALAIQAANILRIVSLFYLGQWSQTWFEWMHLYVWEILMVGLGVFTLSIRQTPAPAIAGAAQ
jgi:exosortase H (IPTLxxWG-CTERM-specific)